MMRICKGDVGAMCIGKTEDLKTGILKPAPKNQVVEAVSQPQQRGFKTVWMRIVRVFSGDEATWRIGEWQGGKGVGKKC